MLFHIVSPILSKKSNQSNQKCFPKTAEKIFGILNFFKFNFGLLISNSENLRITMFIRSGPRFRNSPGLEKK